MLQSNSEGLGNRLEAMSQAADNAMLREREAEDKLDAALSVHARQLSQRQVCELICMHLLFWPSLLNIVVG